MLEHCGITFSWGTEFGKGGPILAAKIGPGGTVFGGGPIFSLQASENFQIYSRNNFNFKERMLLS